MLLLIKQWVPGFRYEEIERRECRWVDVRPSSDSRPTGSADFVEMVLRKGKVDIVRVDSFNDGQIRMEVILTRGAKYVIDGGTPVEAPKAEALKTEGTDATA